MSGIPAFNLSFPSPFTTPLLFACVAKVCGRGTHFVVSVLPKEEHVSILNALSTKPYDCCLIGCVARINEVKGHIFTAQIPTSRCIGELTRASEQTPEIITNFIASQWPVATAEEMIE